MLYPQTPNSHTRQLPLFHCQLLPYTILYLNYQHMLHREQEKKHKTVKPENEGENQLFVSEENATGLLLFCKTNKWK